MSEPSNGPVEEKQCRICLDGLSAERELGRLIRPCLCKGSISVSKLSSWCSTTLISDSFPSMCISSASNDGEQQLHQTVHFSPVRNVITGTGLLALNLQGLQPIQVYFPSLCIIESKTAKFVPCLPSHRWGTLWNHLHMYRHACVLHHHLIPFCVRRTNILLLSIFLRLSIRPSTRSDHRGASYSERGRHHWCLQ